MRLLLALSFLALTLPAQAQERFFQACVASASASEMPEGMDPSAICGCAAQQAARAGVAPADLDALADHLPAGGGSLDTAALPAELQPAAEAGGQALVGCALQLGMAEMMESGMETVAEAMATGMAEAVEGLAAAAPPAAAAPAAGTGLPPQLAAQTPAAQAARLAAAEQAQGAAAVAAAGIVAPTVAPDGTVASAPTSRTAPAVAPGFRTGSGRPAILAVRASKGAAIRILE